MILFRIFKEGKTEYKVRKKYESLIRINTFLLALNACFKVFLLAKYFVRYPGFLS